MNIFRTSSSAIRRLQRPNIKINFTTNTHLIAKTISQKYKLSAKPICWTDLVLIIFLVNKSYLEKSVRLDRRSSSAHCFATIILAIGCVVSEKNDFCFLSLKSSSCRAWRVMTHDVWEMLNHHLTKNLKGVESTLSTPKLDFPSIA